MAGFCELGIGLQAPHLSTFTAKTPKVSGRMPEYSRFRETAIGDCVRSTLRGGLAVQLPDILSLGREKSGMRSRQCGVEAAVFWLSKISPSAAFASRQLEHRGKSPGTGPNVAPSEQKPDLYAAATCTKVQPYRALPRYRLQRTFPSSGDCRLRPACDLEAATCPSGMQLLLLLGSLLCHLLGSCLRGLLCLLCFLGHVVLYKNWFNEYAHAVHRHAHH